MPVSLDPEIESPAQHTLFTPLLQPLHRPIVTYSTKRIVQSLRRTLQREQGMVGTSVKPVHLSFRKPCRSLHTQ